MSRIGKKPIIISKGVSATLVDRLIKIKGPKGELSFDFGYEVEVEVTGEEILVKKIGKTKLAPAMWGTTRALISNMVEGVSVGFKKQLELYGVGYRMAVQGKKMVLNLGFSHPVEVDIPEGISVSVEKELLTIEGFDKQRVGHFASKIRSLKEVEPYKGKGFRYVGEQFIKKEGKKSSKGE